MKIIRETGSHFDLDESRSGRLLDEMLGRPLFAHLATASAAGPRESPVWFLWEQEALWIIGHYQTDTFPLRLELEPRCAIGIVDFNPVTGLVQHVGFRGQATLQPHNEERTKRLLSRYLGPNVTEWDPRFIAVLGDTEFILIRFVPETAVVRDQSYLVRANAPTVSDDIP